MIANYHTHTPRCGHASGTPYEYAQAATENGLKILGFSDHVPCPFSNGYESGFRMKVSETPEYVSDILMVREAFAGKLKVHIGYEAEYYPAEFEGMLANVCKYGCEYLLLGQHCLNNEYDGVPSGGPMTDPALLTRYADQCIAGLETGAYSCIVHPDMPNYLPDDGVYETQMARICAAAKRLDIPLELNAFGLWDKRVYPNKRFWAIAKDTNNAVIINCDAHWAAFTGAPEAVIPAERFLEYFGIKPLQELPFRSPSAALAALRAAQSAE